MELNFCSFSSGSSGNCYYLGNGFQGILIDAGISAGSVRKHLKNLDIPIDTIMGILITHNHTDHIRGLEVLTRRYHLPVFTTGKIWRSIFTSEIGINSDCIREISIMNSFHIAGFDIEAFPVYHDAPETVGFHIRAGVKKITLVTDLGHICKTAALYIKKANFLVIESNYDEKMLLNGSYPYHLKERIRSDYGHLGNHQTAAHLADILNDNLTDICLAHLSKNNNTPELALKTLQQTFNSKGIALNGHQRIYVLNRDRPTEMIRMTG